MESFPNKYCFPLCQTTDSLVDKVRAMVFPSPLDPATNSGQI